MTLVLVSMDGTPAYTALFSDIIDNKISGANIIGKLVYLTDIKKSYVISYDLSLVECAPTEISLFSHYGELRIGQLKYAPVVSDEMHFHIHDGTLWCASYFTPGLASNATVGFGISTGSRNVHLVLEYSASGDGKMEFYTGTSFTGGTQITAINHDLSIQEDVGSSPTVSMVYNPSVTILGSIFRTIYIPGGSGNNRVGGGGSFSKEFILPPNTNSYCKFTNLGGNNSIFNLLIDFYET